MLNVMGRARGDSLSIVLKVSSIFKRFFSLSNVVGFSSPGIEEAP